MTLAEWESLSERGRNEICAETVMGWEKGSRDGTRWTKDGEEVRVGGFYPASDRNDTVLLLDKIAEREQQRKFVRELLKIVSPLDIPAAIIAGNIPLGMLWEHLWVLVNPACSILAYCAVTACG